MRGIGGNINAVVQVRIGTTKNAIGEGIINWADAQTLHGWLDLFSGRASYSTYNAKIQESTHLFICDYVPLDSRISAEKARMKINGMVYEITMIDNPMEMQSGSQLEIYLKYTGGQ